MARVSSGGSLRDLSVLSQDHRAWTPEDCGGVDAVTESREPWGQPCCDAWRFRHARQGGIPDDEACPAAWPEVVSDRLCTWLGR